MTNFNIQFFHSVTLEKKKLPIAKKNKTYIIIIFQLCRPETTQIINLDFRIRARASIFLTFWFNQDGDISNKILDKVVEDETDTIDEEKGYLT